MYKRFVRHPWVLRSLAYTGHKVLKTVHWWHRWTVCNQPNTLWQNKQPFIVVFWHDQILMPCFFWKSTQPFFMLQSRHPDGQLVAKMVQYENIQWIAGSSKNHGATALRAMIRHLKQSHCVGITPDGPRGPQYQVKEGVAMLARLAQCPVVPLAWTTSSIYHIPSWDKMRVPLPSFTALGHVVWGDPLPPPQHRYQDSTFCQAIQQALNTVVHKSKCASSTV